MSKSTMAYFNCNCAITGKRKAQVNKFQGAVVYKPSCHSVVVLMQQRMSAYTAQRCVTLCSLMPSLVPSWPTIHQCCHWLLAGTRWKSQHSHQAGQVWLSTGSSSPKGHQEGRCGWYKVTEAMCWFCITWTLTITTKWLQSCTDSYNSHNSSQNI